jgi:hypothetical protein
VAKAAKMKNSAKPPAKLFTLRPMWITMVQSTSDSSGGQGDTRSGSMWQEMVMVLVFCSASSPDGFLEPWIPAVLLGSPCTAGLA